MKEYDSDASKPDALKDALEAFEKSAEHDDHNRKACWRTSGLSGCAGTGNLRAGPA